MNPVVQHHFFSLFSALAPFSDRFSLYDEEKAIEISGGKRKRKACPPLGRPSHILRLVSSVPVWFPNYLHIKFCGLNGMPLSGAGSVVSSTKTHNLRLKELQLLREK